MRVPRARLLCLLCRSACDCILICLPPVAQVYGALAFPGLVLESCERYRAANGFCWFGTAYHLRSGLTSLACCAGYQICDNGYWSANYLRESSTCSADYNQMMA